MNGHFMSSEERRARVRLHSRVLLFLSLLLVMINVVCVFAAGDGKTLSGLTGDQNQASTGSSGGLLQGLDDSLDMSSAEDATVQKVKEPLKRVFGLIVQVGAYILSLGVMAVTVLDLVYICIPPLQPLLGMGQQGMPQGGGQQPGMGGMGASPMGGMGMHGGMGMGMGMRPMGGMGMGGMGMAGGMGGMGAQQQPMNSGWCLVSKSALNAVASAGMPDATGKPMHPLKIYGKDATFTLVMSSVLLVLTVTGILGKLGLAIGEALGGIIQAAIGFM